MAVESFSVGEILSKIGLGALETNFVEENIDTLEACKSLTDQEMARLGLSTIGTRIKFVEQLKKTEAAPATRMATEIGSLFGPSRSRFTRLNRREKTKQRTWTGKFLCLSDKNKEKTPTAEEKMTLQKSGLGFKKIQFDSSDKETNVHEILCTQFPKLKNCGGFELLRCSSNCKKLQVIDVKWDIQNLKNIVGNQANVYIRPIQKSIEVQMELPAEMNEIVELCQRCKKQIKVLNLRQHLEECQTDIPQDNDVSDMETIIDVDLFNSLQQPFNERATVGQQPLYETATVGQQPLIVTATAGEQPLNVRATVGHQPLYDTATVNEQPLNERATVDHRPLYETATIGINETATVGEQPLINTATVGLNETATIGQQPLKEHQTVQEIIQQTCQLCTENNIDNPVEILRLFQNRIVTGRDLDVTDETVVLSGNTNFILVDRNDCLQTAFDEIRNLKDLRICLEVQFYNEAAVDLGGPRKEFFTIVLQRIQEEYFDPVKEWSEDYELIGKIMALSTLQNGKLPRILSAELVTEVFFSETPRKFVRDLRTGLDSLGIFQLACRLQTLVHLFTPQTTPLTFRMLSTLLRPNFSLEGSNQRMVENRVYHLFIKYLREAAAGRRQGVSLSSVLKFVTGAEEEPVLGFAIQPSLHFVMSASFLPSANTCSNRLNLTTPTDDLPMPSSAELFKLYDYAFLNSYFGYE